MFWSPSPTRVTMEPCFPVDPTGGIPLTSVFETYQSDIKFVTTFSPLGMNNDPSNVMEDSIDTERQTFTQIRVQGTTVRAGWRYLKIVFKIKYYSRFFMYQVKIRPTNKSSC